MYQHLVKRILDLLTALLALLLGALPMAVVALITKLDSPGPVLFRQQRVGRGKKAFTMLKFRSMPTTVSPNTPTHLLTEAVPLTRWQRFMRRASIDELPQLFNVLAGHMSLIGPRPALWNQEDLITAREALGANDVRPGLTGLAQVSGRDELDIAEKARLDGVYAQALKNGRFRGFAMDARCFIITFSVVLRGSGVQEGGTAEEDHHE